MSTPTPAGTPAPTAAPEPAPVAPATPVAPAAPPAPPAAAATPPAQPAAPVDEPWSDPEKAKAEIERLRRENAASRTNAKATAADEARKELAQQIGKALGLVADDDTPPDPAALTAEVEAGRAENRTLAVELAVYKSVTQHGGNAAALTDSRAFLAKVADLDPKAEDFTTKVIDAAKAAVTANPTLKATPQAGIASAIDHAGGSGEGAVTKEQFAAMTPAEKNALFKSNPTLYRQLTGR